MTVGGVHIQAYGVLVLAAMIAATLVAVFTRKRFGLSGAAVATIVPIAIVAAVLVGHVFDVFAYQLDAVEDDFGLWLHPMSGQSLFGVIIGVAVVAGIVGFARRIPGPALADWTALALLVAMVIGRIGCALVHDHPGPPTTSVLGVELEPWQLRWMHLPAGVTRVHDLGLEELLALVPILGVAIALAVRRRTRPGTLAVVAALAYAVVRFGLDFLRTPATEPRTLGLTAGQWGCIALAICGALGAWRVRTTAAVTA